MFHTLTNTYREVESEDKPRTKLSNKKDDCILPILIFHLYVATFQLDMHMEYKFQLIKYYSSRGFC
jgi:hypothetical protein